MKRGTPTAACPPQTSIDGGSHIPLVPSSSAYKAMHSWCAVMLCALLIFEPTRPQPCVQEMEGREAALGAMVDHARRVGSMQVLVLCILHRHASLLADPSQKFKPFAVVSSATV